MPTDIVMPQMGESIVEGTITKWLKKPGDKVQRDEPLFEISTDKVDAEIPSPAAGVLQDIKVAEGTTVQVNTVVGTIASDGEAPAKAAPKAAPAQRRKPRLLLPLQRNPLPRPNLRPCTKPRTKKTSTPARRRWSAKSRASTTSISRKFPAQDSVDASPSKTSWRSSKASAEAPARRAPRLQPQREPSSSAPVQRPSRPPAAIPGDLVPLTNMRRIIAQRMIESRRTSAHVHAMFQVDITNIVTLRNKLKSGFEQRNGARLTFMPFFVRAAIIALQQFPIVNASIEGG